MDHLTNEEISRKITSILRREFVVKLMMSSISLFIIIFAGFEEESM